MDIRINGTNWNANSVAAENKDQFIADNMHQYSGMDEENKAILLGKVHDKCSADVAAAPPVETPKKPRKTKSKSVVADQLDTPDAE